MIELRFNDLRSERPAPEHPADVLVGVTADLELVTDRGLIYSEPDFPVVELAADLANWLDEGAPQGRDFEFDSMETPEPGWIWIRQADDRWCVGSINQHQMDPQARDLDEVRSAVQAFLSTLERHLRERWGIELDRYTSARDT